MSYISAPLVRIYGFSHLELADGEFILRRRVESYDNLFSYIPMTVRAEPWSPEKASGTDALEEKVAGEIVSEEMSREPSDEESEVD